MCPSRVSQAVIGGAVVSPVAVTVVGRIRAPAPVATTADSTRMTGVAVAESGRRRVRVSNRTAGAPRAGTMTAMIEVASGIGQLARNAAIAPARTGVNPVTPRVGPRMVPHRGIGTPRNGGPMAHGAAGRTSLGRIEVRAAQRRAPATRHPAVPVGVPHAGVVRTRTRTTAVDTPLAIAAVAIFVVMITAVAITAVPRGAIAIYVARGTRVSVVVTRIRIRRRQRAGHMTSDVVRVDTGLLATPSGEVLLGRVSGGIATSDRAVHAVTRGGAPTIVAVFPGIVVTSGQAGLTGIPVPVAPVMPAVIPAVTSAVTTSVTSGTAVDGISVGGSGRGTIAAMSGPLRIGRSRIADPPVALADPLIAVVNTAVVNTIAVNTAVAKPAVTLAGRDGTAHGTGDRPAGMIIEAMRTGTVGGPITHVPVPSDPRRTARKKQRCPRSLNPSTFPSAQKPSRKPLRPPLTYPVS